ncbi:MAG: PAS domain S-box protein, partial [Planctomycetota bacterium]
MDMNGNDEDYSVDVADRSTLWFVVSIMSLSFLLGLLVWQYVFYSNQFNPVHAKRIAFQDACQGLTRNAENMNMAVRLSTLSGNLRWKEQYEEARKRLEGHFLDIATGSGTPEIVQNTRKIASQLEMFTTMAGEVFERVRQGDEEGASERLSGGEYQQSQRNLEAAINTLDSASREYLQNGMAFQGDRILFLIALLSLSLVILFVAWAITVRNWQTQIKKKQDALQHRLEFEERISAVSSQLINMESDGFDAVIEGALASIGDFVGAGRAYLFQLHDEWQLMSNTHEWCAEGVNPEIGKLQNIPMDSVPWWTRKLRNGETIHLRSLSELPPEAEKSRCILESQNIRSLIVVPLIFEHELIGFIGFDAVEERRQWSSETVFLLQTTGEIVIQGLQRCRTKRALEKSEEKYRRMFDLSPEAIVLLSTEGVVQDVNGRLTDWLDYRAEEVIGKKLGELPYLPQKS